MLIKAINLNEDQNTYLFNPCDLGNYWDQYPIKWHTMNYKFDYIIASFSLMHFCTDLFWQQLNNIVIKGTKFIFNLVNISDNINKWSHSESFLTVEENKVMYKIEWVHNEIKTEPYIHANIIDKYLEKYDWKIIKKHKFNSSYKLIHFYEWYIIEKI